MGKKITSREEDYSRWYNDIVSEAGLAESSDVRGCMVIKPYGLITIHPLTSEDSASPASETISLYLSLIHI